MERASLKIELEKGLLHADDHGDIILYSPDYHGEINLGNINYDGEYDAPFWMGESEPFIDEVKSALIEQYFGERKGYQERSQMEWPDNIVQFLKVDDQQDTSYSSFSKISEDGQSLRTEQGRHRDVEGQSLHGLYENKEENVTRHILFNHGKNCLDYQFSSQELKFKSELLNFDNLKTLESLNWCDEKGESVNSGRVSFERVLAGQKPMGKVVVQSKAAVTKCIADAEANDSALQVFRHTSDDERFRLIVFRNQKFAEAFAVDTMIEDIEALSPTSSESIVKELNLVSDKHLSDCIEYMQTDSSEEAARNFVKYILSGLPLVSALGLV